MDYVGPNPRSYGSANHGKSSPKVLRILENSGPRAGVGVEPSSQMGPGLLMSRGQSHESRPGPGGFEELGSSDGKGELLRELVPSQCPLLRESREPRVSARQHSSPDRQQGGRERRSPRPGWVRGATQDSSWMELGGNIQELWILLWTEWLLCHMPLGHRGRDGQFLSCSHCHGLENQALCWPEPRGLTHLPFTEGIVVQTVGKGLVMCFWKQGAEGQGQNG